MLVVNWGNPAVIAQPYWAGGVLPMLSGVISGIVQSFFAWRIYTFKPKRLVLGVSCLIIVIALVQCINSAIVSAQFFVDPTHLGPVFVKHYIWLSGNLIADFLITVSMVTLLWNARSSSFLETTDRMIMRLIILTLEVGAVTTVVSGADLVITRRHQNTPLYEVPTYILAKLSNISLLISLNSRGYIRNGAGGSVGTSASTANAIKFATVDCQGLSENQVDSRQLDIHINTSTTTDCNDYKMNQIRV